MDDGLADLLADALASEVNCFVDHRCIPLGASWSVPITNAFHDAKVVIGLVSEAWMMESEHLQGEIETARRLKKLLLVWVGGLPGPEARILPVFHALQDLSWSPPNEVGLTKLLPKLREELLKRGLGRPWAWRAVPVVEHRQLSEALGRICQPGEVDAHMRKMEFKFPTRLTWAGLLAHLCDQAGWANALFDHLKSTRGDAVRTHLLPWKAQ